MFGKILAAIAASVTFMLASAPGAQAASIATIWSFCPSGDCSKGGQPSSPILMDKAGNLYGTTVDGGADNAGVVYEYTRAGEFIDLTSFCSDCSTGSKPYGPLVIDKKGNIYGTASVTPQNVNSGAGVVYELVKKDSWKVQILYTFCAQASCADGYGPSFGLTYAGQASGMPYDGTSPLYGVAAGGGPLDDGVAFKLTPKKKTWSYTVLHGFCSEKNCADGKGPDALIADVSGNLYGTTSGAGLSNIFALAPDGTETVLHHFCAVKSCADGNSPVGLFMDAAGNFFGADASGGKKKHGIAFEFDAKGNFHDLYDFCAQKSCPDGYGDGMPVMDSDANLYGLLTNGGGLGFGSAYEIPRGGSFTKLFDFCSDGCAAGDHPAYVPTLDSHGNLYGVTQLGGDGKGTIFMLAH